MSLVRSSRLKRIVAAIVALLVTLSMLLTTFAYASAMTGDLLVVYQNRPDLQRLFDAQGGKLPGAKTPLKSLEDWAQKYGHREYPELLAEYAPQGSLFKINAAALRPVGDGASFPLSVVTAQAIYVVDVPSERVIYSYNADKVHPVASLTKLMTSMVSLDAKLSMDKKMALLPADEVGGARLRVATGDKYLTRDLLYATLVGSANNAANAIARATGLSRAAFLARMNAKAKALGATKTKFVDPTGIEVENVSTAKEIAGIALRAFAYNDIRRMTTTAKYSIATAESTHTIKNTNGLLTDENNGLYVLGGKTGYLPESGWNLAVKMRDHRNRPILVVVLGTGSQGQSFKDAETVAKWVWAHTKWVK